MLNKLSAIYDELSQEDKKIIDFLKEVRTDDKRN